MRSLRIRGGKPLIGEIRISGAKNAALPVLAATVCFRDVCTIQDCPNLSDVDAAMAILTHLGANCQRSGKTITVDPRPIDRWDIPEALMQQMRGSVFFMGPLMARFGKCCLTQPGGCPLGDRPVNFHLQGLERMGARVRWEGTLCCTGPLSGNDIFLPYPSVGATENLLMAALGAQGEMVIHNAAREPEVVCLCDFLRLGGCRITGDGTSVIRIWQGLPGSAEMTLIPDRMEAATYLCAAAATNGYIRLTNADPAHLQSVIDVLEKAGCRIELEKEAIVLCADGLQSPGMITTGPYPAFPTDAQAPIMAALLRAKGETRIRETVFSQRMHHIPALCAMGGEIAGRGDTAVITGVPRLHGASVTAADLRGAAALVIAALSAEGESEISGLRHLLRGYEDIAGKLTSLGAKLSIG